jgi:hypothetical protein
MLVFLMEVIVYSFRRAEPGSGCRGYVWDLRTKLRGVAFKLSGFFLCAAVGNTVQVTRLG